MLASTILLALVSIARVAVAQGLDPHSVPQSTRGLYQSLQSAISTARPLLISLCRLLVLPTDNILSFDLSPDSRCRWSSNCQRMQLSMYPFHWWHLHRYSFSTRHYWCWQGHNRTSYLSGVNAAMACTRMFLNIHRLCLTSFALRRTMSVWTTALGIRSVRLHAGRTILVALRTLHTIASPSPQLAQPVPQVEVLQ
jgi:hypothetical protein